MNDPPEAISLADSDEIERRERIWEDFRVNILDLPWAFVSNGSTLQDFDGLHSREELERRIEARYGFKLLSEHFEMPLFQLLDHLRPPMQA